MGSDWRVHDDLRLAIRSLRRRPTFTVIVVVTLALGIGPAVVVFDLADQLLLRPLPGVPNTGRAAYLVFGEPGRGGGLSDPDFDELRRRASLVDGLAAYGNMFLVGTSMEGRPIDIWAHSIKGDYFEILGAIPIEGRLLTAEENDPDTNPLVAVINERLRDRVFGPGESAVGRTIALNGHDVTVIGVVGGGFTGAERGAGAEVWLPRSSLVPMAGFPPDRLVSRESTMHRDLILHLRDGVAAGAVEAQVLQVLTGMEATTPESVDHLLEAGPSVYEGLHTPPLVRENTQRTLRMMAWAVALILAISCANVANLLLFRNLARRPEHATLRALGASSWALARLQLAESVALGLLGGLGGVVVAWAIALPFGGERLAGLPAFEDFVVSPSSAVFVILAAMLTAVAFGAVPAALAGRFDLSAGLKASQSRGTGRVGGLRLALSAGQISMTLALLVGGMLMVRTIANLRSVDTGVDIERVASAPIAMRTATEPPEAAHLRQREMLAALRALPEVEAAGLDLFGPHGSREVNQVGLPGVPIVPQATMESSTTLWPVTPGWFDVFGVAPIAGRTFRDSDWRIPSGPEVVLTASLARRLFGRTDVVGQTVMVGRRNAGERRVIGVVADYRSMTNPSEPLDALFVPIGSIPRPDVTVMVKMRPEGILGLTRVRQTIESYYPDVPVLEPTFISDRVEGLRTAERLLGYLLWILSTFGVLMSAVGLYGVIHFIVSSRLKELGIRRALGADALRILRVVTASATEIVIAGVAIGALMAYLLSDALASELFGVDPIDAISYVGAAILVVAAAFVAGVAPARAALKVDPAAVLKDE